MVTVTIDAVTIISIAVPVLIIIIVIIFMEYTETDNQLKYERYKASYYEKCYKEGQDNYFTLYKKHKELKKKLED